MLLEVFHTHWRWAHILPYKETANVVYYILSSIANYRQKLAFLVLLLKIRNIPLLKQQQ